MNCKQSDLAIIIRCPPKPEAVGRIVECLRFMGTYPIEGRTYLDVWEVNWNGNDPKDYFVRGWGMPDAWLRPIRGSEGPDESLEWLDRELGYDKEGQREEELV